MTDREKAIVMAHTGVCMLAGAKISVFYQYLYELYGRPVYTHEFVTLDIKEKSKPDFLQLCKEEEPKRHGHWIYKGNIGRFPACECSVCGNVENADWAILSDNVNYCPNCGAKMEEE